MNVYEGFQYPGADTHQGIVKFLSNADVSNSDDTTERTTIEHYIGNQLGSPTLALGAVAHRSFGQDFDAKLMWDGQAVVPQKNPLIAYDELFSGLGTGAPAPDSQDALHSSLLKLTEADIESLQGDVMGLSSEQSKLTTHLESIRALNSGSSAAISCTTAPVLEAIDSLRTAAAGQGDDWFLKEENFPAILAAQLEVAAAAMLCNARPITAIQSLYANCEIDFGFMGSAGSHHSTLSHTGPQIASGVADLNARDSFAKAQRWFVEMLTTHLVDKLAVDDPADPGSTVLDNTIILLCSEIGEGAWHTSFTREIMTGPPPGLLSYMPIVTIGGAGGGLKAGQRLSYYDASQAEGSRDRPAGDVWLTLAKAMGISTTEFGGSTSALTEALA